MPPKGIATLMIQQIVPGFINSSPGLTSILKNAITLRYMLFCTYPHIPRSAKSQNKGHLKVNCHPARTHVQEAAEAGQAETEPPQLVGVDVLHHVLRVLGLELDFPVEGHFGVEPTL